MDSNTAISCMATTFFFFCAENSNFTLPYASVYIPFLTTGMGSINVWCVRISSILLVCVNECEGIIFCFVIIDNFIITPYIKSCKMKYLLRLNNGNYRVKI